MSHGFPQGLTEDLLSKLFPGLANLNGQTFQNLQNLQTFQNIVTGFKMPKEEENNENYEPQAKHVKLDDERDGDSGIAHTPSPHNLSDDGEIPALQIADEEEGVEEDEEEEKPPLSPVSSVSLENNENATPPGLLMAPFVANPDALNLFPGRIYNKIVKDAYFNSYEDFQNVFKEWMYTNYHPFRVASSEKMVDTAFSEVFKYRYIVYHCKHYGSPRRRGQGKRPNQSYMPCGCKAMLRLNYQSNERALRLTTIVETHEGHEVSKDAYDKSLSNHRRSATPRGSPLRMVHSPNNLLGQPLNLNNSFGNPQMHPQVQQFNAHSYQQASIMALLLQNQNQIQHKLFQNMINANPPEQQALSFEHLANAVPAQESPSEETPVEVKTEPINQEHDSSLLQLPFPELPQLARPTPTRPQIPLENLNFLSQIFHAQFEEKQRRVKSVIDRLESHLQTVDDPQFCTLLRQLEALLPQN